MDSRFVVALGVGNTTAGPQAVEGVVDIQVVGIRVAVGAGKYPAKRQNSLDGMEFLVARPSCATGWHL